MSPVPWAWSCLGDGMGMVAERPGESETQGDLLLGDWSQCPDDSQECVWKGSLRMQFAHGVKGQVIQSLTNSFFSGMFQGDPGEDGRPVSSIFLLSDVWSSCEA